MVVVVDALVFDKNIAVISIFTAVVGTGTGVLERAPQRFHPPQGFANPLARFGGHAANLRVCALNITVTAFAGSTGSTKTKDRSVIFGCNADLIAGQFPSNRTGSGPVISRQLFPRQLADKALDRRNFLAIGQGGLLLFVLIGLRFPFRSISAQIQDSGNRINIKIIRRHARTYGSAAAAAGINAQTSRHIEQKGIVGSLDCNMRRRDIGSGIYGCHGVHGSVHHVNHTRNSQRTAADAGTQNQPQCMDFIIGLHINLLALELTALSHQAHAAAAYFLHVDAGTYQAALSLLQRQFVAGRSYIAKQKALGFSLNDYLALIRVTLFGLIGVNLLRLTRVNLWGLTGTRILNLNRLNNPVLPDQDLAVVMHVSHVNRAGQAKLRGGLGRASLVSQGSSTEIRIISQVQRI